MNCPMCGMSEWISVKDRLPERDLDVLVLEKRWTPYVGGTINMRYIPRYIDGTCAGDDGMVWYPGGLAVNCTTHWMHIPDAPE